MLNIISKTIDSSEVSGPGKVVKNLTKGLDLLQYPYCINKALDTTSQLWIHDDTDAVKTAAQLKLNAVVGPLYILQRNVPTHIDMSHFIYIQPSKWAADLWTDFGFNRCPMDFWPTGIDTEEFQERTNPGDGIVLIYFKQRYDEELNYVKNKLESDKIRYETITYGSYSQDNYIKKLKNTKYIIWIGRQESQGIALEEALSMNIPILVWDVKNLGHWSSSKKSMAVFNDNENAYEKATAAPYFDDRCGIITKNKIEVSDLIEKMEVGWNINFKPREYILENLNLEKQARAMIELFNTHFNMSYEAGKNESPRSGKKWKNDLWYFKAKIFLKDIIKQCVKSLKK